LASYSHFDFIEEEWRPLADQGKIEQLRASLAREENKLPRQVKAVQATEGLIAVIKAELERELKKA
jgi:hypothetical protein